ncbi:toxin C-terminal domain-containing protein [Ponticaulis sp.]|uniref:toxin C-terminal domain-containing protein n=1 Tax=Ponticaulis sp. TaxID=2020902 RepID=UPI00341D5AF5
MHPTRHKVTDTNGGRFITPDVDGHKGGIWKMFDRGGARLGTYDASLQNRLGR